MAGFAEGALGGVLGNRMCSRPLRNAHVIREVRRNAPASPHRSEIKRYGTATGHGLAA